MTIEFKKVSKKTLRKKSAPASAPDEDAALGNSDASLGNSAVRNSALGNSWCDISLIPRDWRDEIVEKESKKAYWKCIIAKIAKDEDEGKEIFPLSNDRFLFMSLALEDIKVVILGQDPYHGPNQAHGLAFSVQKGVQIPPSLVNIYKELRDDLGPAYDLPNHGYLMEWHHQGVLLLNTTLTVKKGTPNSHAKSGWQTFTDEIIKYLSSKKTNLVFCLWGKFAQSKDKFISQNRHLVLKAAHPSPLGANKGGWWGCKHFSKANTYLIKKGKSPIDWSITSI